VAGQDSRTARAFRAPGLGGRLTTQSVESFGTGAVIAYREHLSGLPTGTVSMVLRAASQVVNSPGALRRVGHGLAIILDLAMGGAYPDTVCGCRAPGNSTTSGGTMSVRYVAVYRGSFGAWLTWRSSLRLPPRSAWQKPCRVRSASSSNSPEGPTALTPFY
jgi:hypothetical protein